MRIDEALHLIIPIDRADGVTIYVHAAPISREVFQRYWKPMARAYNDIIQQQLVVTGPRIAALALREAAREAGALDGPVGVEAGLLMEIRRLANVVTPGGNGQSGWQMVALDDALKGDLISQDDADEVEGVLCFFTLAWRLHRSQDRRAWLSSAAAVWGARTSSLNYTGFVASLTTSTATASTGAISPAASSPPFSIGPQMPGSPSASPSEPTVFPGIAA